jgi:biopolymer transport protein ExbD
MSMSVGTSDPNKELEPMMEINTTPLIDVMLVLIIMMIITIPPQTHAVKLNMPIPNNAPPPPKEPVVVKIDIDFDGTVLWDAIPVSGRKELEDKLKIVAGQTEQPEVHVRPNKLVEYKSVAMVMASAQRLGVTKMGIVGNEQFVK